ncbi:MAG TPA: dihydrodipicolinate reductase [bacterium]|nr:dihydrodipicolinate reductase [bacterium]HRS73252.1 dihydrodipicolinate reductase [Patescibacteria group bacterium]HOR69393.1 dihydrodipicolinate reductase [bacterium]HPD03535.1 dihydrodipicolinate reductase [bacterium]HPL83630.1 dihydrodipicolinate reductase [bacterium]
MNKNIETRTIRAIQYGCGKMGSLIMKYLYEKGVEIVGAIDNNPVLIGQDIGDLMGLNQKLGLAVHSYPEEVFAANPADVCIVAINGLLTEIYPLLTIPLKYGVNTITTCSEAVFPWTTSPEFAKRLDELAKKNYCTLTASGYQDIFWGHLISNLAGGSQKINVLEGTTNYNLEEYGISMAKSYGVDFNIDEFNKKIGQNNLLPSPIWNAAEWLVARLGWTVKNINQKLVPIIAEQPTLSSLLNKTISAGNCLGLTVTINLETNEGPIIQLQHRGQVGSAGQLNISEWTIKGEFTTKLRLEQESTIKTACATIVNRVPEVMMAKPGYITTNNWPGASYRERPLLSYLPLK